MPSQRQIFICYRRTDAGAYAGRLYDALSKDFGAKKVFFDSGGGITAGDDWKQVIEERLASCAVLVALIGTNWQPERLANPDDLVRREISGALALGVRVIPIVVNDAALPRPADLPEELHPLLGRQMLEMTDRHWRADYEQLTTAIRSEIARRRSKRIEAFLHSRIVRASVAIAIAAVLAVPIAYTIQNWKPAATPASAVPTTVPMTTAAPTKTASKPTIGFNLGMGSRLDRPPREASFVFMNVGNPNFDGTWAEAGHRGLIRGVYWTYSEKRHPVDQADDFLKRVSLEKQDLVGVTVVMVSIRGAKVSLSRELHRFLEHIEERTGKRPIIYTTGRVWNESFDDTFGDYPLWFLETELYASPPHGWAGPAFSAHEREEVLERGLPYKLTFHGTLDELIALARP